MLGSKGSGHLPPRLKNQMQQRMENGTALRLLSSSCGIGFSKIRVTFVEFPERWRP